MNYLRTDHKNKILTKKSVFFQFLFLFSMLHLTVAESSVMQGELKLQKMNFSKISDFGQSYNIILKNLDPSNENRVWEIKDNFIKDKNKYLSMLRKLFTNTITHQYVEGTSKQVIYIFPIGANTKKINALISEAEKIEVPENHLSKAEKINAGILTFRQVKRLNLISRQQKQRKQHYQRVVHQDNDNIPDVYTFKVHYDELNGMFRPFEKNGQETIGKLEGFTSHATIFNYIVKNIDRLDPYTYHDELYLRSKDDPESFVRLRLDGDDLDVLINNSGTSSLKYTSQISGSSNDFKTITKFWIKPTPITIADTVQSY